MNILKCFNYILLVILFNSTSFAQDNEIGIILIENIGPCASNEGDVIIFNYKDSLELYNACRNNSDISADMIMYYTYPDSIFSELVCLIKQSLEKDLNISDSLYTNYNNIDTQKSPVPPGSFQIKLFDSNGIFACSRTAIGLKSSRKWFKYLSSNLKENKHPDSKDCAKYIGNIPDLYGIICVEHADN